MTQLSRPGDAVTEVGPGAVLGGRYRLVDRIGAGGMATIYRAVDERLERTVAVKVLHAHLADEAQVLARFRNEGQHAAALNHPHIVAVYDQGAGEVPFLVMEHVEGPSLRDILRAKGRLTPAETLAVLGPVCRALSRAHAAGVVHRDVKPENVLVTPEGVPKVADFGIARALEGTHFTETGALLGSVYYLAPELVGGGEASPASDQYALGVLAFELLTGRKALVGDSAMAVALRHARERIPPPSTLVSDVTAALDAVVVRATDPAPDHRFADLAALEVALVDAVPHGPKPVVVDDPEVTGTDTLVIPAEQVENGWAAGGAFPAAGSAGRRPQPHRQRGTRKPTSSKRRSRKARRARESRGGTARHTRRKRAWGRRLLAASTVLVAMLAVAAGGAYALGYFSPPPIERVPGLEGLTETAADDELAAHGLLLAIAGVEHDLEVEAGSVLTQDPEAGTELIQGEVVEVVLSAGPATVEMPEVMGEDLETARAILVDDPYYLEVTSVDEHYHDTAPAGQVIGQAPDAGSELLQLDGVLLAVSKGIEQVTVPDLAGKTRDEAEAALAEAQLTSEFTEEYSDQVPTAGKVVTQSVAADEEVDKGSTVRVTISLGPLTFPIPRVEGKPVEEAADELRAIGLQVQVIREPRPRVGPFRRGEFGYVEAQNPQPNESVQRGQRVDLYTFAPDDEVDG